MLRKRDERTHRGRREAPNEPTAADQNLTIEPTPAALGDGPRGVVMTAGMNDGDDSDYHKDIDRQKSGEWNRATVARVVALQAAKQRELDDEGRREVQAANAGRRARLDWHKSRNPADRREKRVAGVNPKMTETDTARAVGALAELVSAGSG